MTFVLNAAASNYNCTLSSLWWEFLAPFVAGRTAWWPSTSWCPCSRRTGTMSLVQTVPSCSKDQWQEFWRKEWICRCLPHCNFWRSNDCTSRAPWESLSPSTAETVQRNVAHIGLVLDRKRHDKRVCCEDSAQSQSRSFLTPSLLNLPFEEYNRRFTHTKCMQALSDMPVKSSDNCFSIKAYRKAWSRVIKTCLSTSLFAVYFLPL